MYVKANTAIKWVDANCPAFSWWILAMKQESFEEGDLMGEALSTIQKKLSGN